MGELKHEKGIRDAILGLKSLIRGHRVDRNSADNSKIPGSLADDRIAETLIYGKRKHSGADLEIGKIKKALIDFAKTSDNEQQWEENNTKEEISENRRNRKLSETSN